MSAECTTCGVKIGWAGPHDLFLGEAVFDDGREAWGRVNIRDDGHVRSQQEKPL